MKWLILLIPFSLHANLNRDGFFSGRISLVHSEAGLVRVFVEFANLKYLNKKNIVEFWKDQEMEKNCKGKVIGKSNDHILLKIFKFDSCSRDLFLERGSHIRFYSKDLANNIKIGRELIEILLKKRLGIKGQMEDFKKNIHNYMAKVDAVNKRYEVLRDKLEQEWKKEISYLDQDKITNLSRYKELEIRLDEVEHKLQKYQVGDENLRLDKWSLNPRLYFRK